MTMGLSHQTELIRIERQITNRIVMILIILAVGVVVGCIITAVSVVSMLKISFPSNSDC